LRKARAHKPDIAIIDVRMPPDNTDDGLRAALTIRAEQPQTGVLVLSQYIEEQYAIELIGDAPDGVGYLLKERITDVGALLDAVHRIAARGSVIDPQVVSQLLRRHRQEDPLEELTDREREVLELMAEGRSNHAIAARLVVTERAVEKIVTLVVLLMGIGWIATMHTRTTRYTFSAPLARVDLAMSSGQALIVGTDSSTLQVRRTDQYSFGHSAHEQRSLKDGVLTITSSCPKIVLATCSASYELAVPETVAVTVRTTDGSVRLNGFRGTAAVQTGAGNVDVVAYCGFNLAARTGSGDVHIAAACSPQHLDVSTGSGDAVALVPPGRYQISASSGSGKQHVSGVIRDRTAPFTIAVHSGSGSVAIGGGL
jgi:DNA-binding NarL/FixJ family response regulator